MFVMGNHFSTRWELAKMTVIVQTMFSNSFFYTKWLYIIEYSLKLLPNGPINITSELCQSMAWHRTGDKPLSEPMIAWLTRAYFLYEHALLRLDELIDNGLIHNKTLYINQYRFSTDTNDHKELWLLRNETQHGIERLRWLPLVTRRRSD